MLRSTTECDTSEDIWSERNRFESSAVSWCFPWWALEGENLSDKGFSERTPFWRDFPDFGAAVVWETILVKDVVGFVCIAGVVVVGDVGDADIFVVVDVAGIFGVGVDGVAQ